MDAPFLFMAGKPILGEGWDPTTSVAESPLPPSVSTLDRLVEVSIGAIFNSGSYFQEFSRVTTNIGGRQAIILEFDYRPTGGEGYGDLVHALNMYMIAGNNAWGVGCATSPTDFSDFENTFYEILRSFRISN